MTFYVFLSCCTRFPEQCCLQTPEEGREGKGQGEGKGKEGEVCVIAVGGIDAPALTDSLSIHAVKILE